MSEAICAQCHLRGDATVVRQGRSLTDFQPGMKLTDVRIDYQLETETGAMKVVGHVDQMHASRCYQQSYQQPQNMACTTCHYMHTPESSQPTTRFFRQKCLTCHTVDGCGLPVAQRAIQQPDDNCMKCHMPQVKTDIPHIAFTHHRIGIHKGDDFEGEALATTGRLVPFGDVSHLSADEQQRCLALAYVELADKQPNPELARNYQNQALQLLQQLQSTHSVKHDGDVMAAMARFAWESQQPAVAIQYAIQAIDSLAVSDGPRVNSLLIAGDSFLQLGQSPKSLPYLEKLVQLRRRSQDWYLLGIAQFQSGQKELGITSLQHAIDIQPFRPDLRETLSGMFKATGQVQESEFHRKSALRLTDLP